MGDEELQPAPELEAQPEEASIVEPVDAAKREKRAKAAVKRRLTQKLKKADLDDEDLAELNRIADRKKKKAAAAPEVAPPVPEAQAVADATEGMPPEVAAQVAAIANMNTAELVALVWDSVNTVFLEGTDAELNPKKKKLLVDAWVPMAEKYLPVLASGPEAGALLVTAIVFAGPLGKRLSKKKLVVLPAGAEKAA